MVQAVERNLAGGSPPGTLVEVAGGSSHLVRRNVGEGVLFEAQRYAAANCTENENTWGWIVLVALVLVVVAGHNGRRGGRRLLRIGLRLQPGVLGIGRCKHSIGRSRELLHKKYSTCPAEIRPIRR